VTQHNGSIDVPATKVELDHGVSANLWLSSLAKDMVPVYEEQVTRVERGIDLETWSKMNMDEKAMIIAIRRTNNAISNLQNEAEIRNQKR